MTQDSSKVPPESYFEEQAALQLLVPRAKLLAALADAYGAEPAAPVLFVSPEQLSEHSDPDAEHGRYLPARKTPAGKFTQPLYALPPAVPAATDALGAPGEVVKAIREYLGVHPDLVLGGQVLDSMALELSRIALDYHADLIGALALEELMQLGYTVEAGAILPPRDLPEQACEFFGVRPVAGPSAGMTWWNNASEAERARWSAAAGNTGVPADAYAAFLRHTAAPQGVVAWMQPETMDLMLDEQKIAWIDSYGADWKAKAKRYTVPLGHIGQPAAVAGPAWEKTRDSLSMLMMGFASNPTRSIQAACAVLDSATEPGMPLAYLRGAAPALEAPAALAAKPGGMIAVPFDLVVAACSAIDKKRDAPKILAELRRYTTGDLARALEAPAVDALSQAERDVLAERRRQVAAEGHAAERDDGHNASELAYAAAWYATPPCARHALDVNDMGLWPITWPPGSFKPGDRRRELVKSGALAIAELERLDRTVAHGHKEST